MPPKKTVIGAKQSSGASSKAKVPSKTTTPANKAANKPAASKSHGVAQKTTAASSHKGVLKDNKKEEAKPFQPIKVPLKDLDKVVFQDEDGIVATDGRWPLVMDPSGIAIRFVLHRDANCIDAMNPTEVELESIRSSTLAAIRYGKPLVLDLGDADWTLYDVLVSKFDEIQKGLMDSIITKDILKDEKFLELVRPNDNADEYNKTAVIMDSARMRNFMLVVMTKKLDPPPDLLKQFCVIEITTG